MRMKAVVLEDTFPGLAMGIPEEAKQIAAWDVSRQVAAVNPASEMDLTKIEEEFLREILREQAELNGMDEGAQESEWHLFLENLSPVTPQDCNELQECNLQKEGRRNSGDSSQREWDVLLGRLSKMETTIVQQILGRVQSDVLQGMLNYLHIRMIQGNSGETHWDESIALQNTDAPLDNPPDETENASMHSVRRLSPQEQMGPDAKSIMKELPIVEKRHGTMDWLHWSQHSPPRLTQSTCYFLTDVGKQVNSDQPGNTSQLVNSLLQGTLQEFQPQVPQNFLSKLSPGGEPDQEDVYKELPQHKELQPESEPDPGYREWQTLNLDIRQRCSQQIESTLAEIPSQIAYALFTKPPQNVDSNVLHQLFRQIDKILFQVMPQQILFDSVQPELVESHLFDYLHWQVPPDYSLPRQLDDGLDYTQLNQLEPLNPHHRHQLQSTEIQQDLQQIPPQIECTNGSEQRKLEQLPYQGNQSLDSQEVDQCNPSCQNGPCLWPAMFEYSAGVPNYLQLLPEFVLDSCVTDSLRCPKRDMMSFIRTHVGGNSNPPLIKTESHSSPHPLLDMLPQPETNDDLSLPPLDSDQSLLHLLPRTDVRFPEISLGKDSNEHVHMGLPQEQQQQQVRQCMFPLADTDFVHLLTQSFSEFPFPHMDPVELHALRQKLCLTVLQQIAKQVEYNISQGLPLQVNSDLIEALDLPPQEHWRHPLREKTEANHYYFDHYPDESGEVQEVDVDSDACPETSEPTEDSNDFRELHEDTYSTSGWTTEPSGAESPRYYKADPITKVYNPYSSYKDFNVDSLRQRNPYGTIFQGFAETTNQSVLEAMMPLYSSPLDILGDVSEYIEIVTTGDELQETSEEMEFDHFEPSADYMSSLNLLWVPEHELQQSQVTQQPVDGGIGHSVDFYVDGLAGTASDLLWVLHPNESLNLAEAPQDQQDDTASDVGKDFVVSGELQADDLSESSTKHVLDSNETDGLSPEGTYLSSQSSGSQESGPSWVDAQQLQENAQLDEICCDCYQPQIPESARMQNSHKVDQVHPVKHRKSVEVNPRIASVSSLDGLGGKDSGQALNPNQPNNASTTSNPVQRNRNVHYEQSSDISEGPQVTRRVGERLSSPGSDSGKPRQSHTSSNNEESRDQGASTSEFPKVSPSMVKLTRSMSQKSPTVSQFRDPSTPVRHTIFGLLVLAGGLYLVENRDEIEQQSISAAEATAEAWRWLGNFLIKMARGEFDN